MTFTLPSQNNAEPIAPSLCSEAEALGYELDYDVVVVGGGIAGSVAACGLGQMGLRVAIVETSARSIAADRGQAYSINLLSAQIFKDLGLWDAIRLQVETYRAVRLSDGNYSKVVQFYPSDIGTETIGYVAEHRVLLDALQAKLEQLPNVHGICPATVVATHRNTNHTSITIDQGNGKNRQITTTLVVAADGSRSPLREAANIKTIGWKYWQSCIVAFVQPEYPHDQIAYERFQSDGPFAILPLPNGLCRIVWTALSSDTDRILSLNRDEFMHELRDRYGDQMGRLTLVGEASVFPVRLLHSMRYVQPGLALIGDAAHCCHPVGGQGINLGIRDAAALVSVIQTTIGTQKNFGNLSVLRRYERWRMGENLLVLGLTDTLTRVFSNKIWPIVILRRFSLWVLQHIPPIRGMVLRLMQGLTGRSPHIVPIESTAIQEKTRSTPIERAVVH